MGCAKARGTSIVAMVIPGTPGHLLKFTMRMYQKEPDSGTPHSQLHALAIASRSAEKMNESLGVSLPAKWLVRQGCSEPLRKRVICTAEPQAAKTPWLPSSSPFTPSTKMEFIDRLIKFSITKLVCFTFKNWRKSKYRGNMFEALTEKKEEAPITQENHHNDFPVLPA